MMKGLMVKKKKIKGRKRHIITDIEGNLLFVKVHKANVHDTQSGRKIIESMMNKFPSIDEVVGDNGYRGTCYNFVTNVLNKSMIISKKIKDRFVIQPVRWVVERTFAWLNNFRRLSKDYEYTISSSESMIMIAYGMILIKRLKT